MADMVLSTVAAKLAVIAGNLIVKEGSRLFQLKEDILWIEKEMRHIRSYLEDVDAKQWGSRGVIDLIRDIWDLAYDVENIIDKYFPKLASRRGSNHWKRRLGWFKRAKCIRDFAVLIEGIKRRVEDISRVRQTYGIKERSGSDEGDARDPRRSFLHIDEENVIGFDEHIKELVTKVIDEDLQYRVVSITGMAGLGKTTLAKKVYKSVQHIFQCSAWIYVSRQPNINAILREIGRQVGLEEKKCEDNVEANLFEFLSQKRYVIVIDDIWNIEPWNALKNCIPANSKKGNRIVITSRNNNLCVDIGARVGGQSFLHELQPLDQTNSSNLFFKMIMAAPQINDQSNDPSNLKNIGEQILERCHGVPLAIVVTVGLLLARERTAHEWKGVLESMGQDEDQYSNIFALSYKDLPSKLKPCFLYFGLFPEDHEIFAFDLINLWAAEGLIQGSEVREVEDVGNDYLNHLIGRNLIQVVRRRFNGRVRSCRIHDILHNLCIRVANEINFFSTHNNVVTHNSALGIRRITIHGINFDDYISLNHQTPKLRALFFSGERFHTQRKCPDKDFLGGFKFLHVLSVRYSSFPWYFQNEIGNFNHLSYLGFAGRGIIRIPYTISKLKSLTTLDLRGCLGALIPNVLWNMQQLRHILLPTMCHSSVAPSFSVVEFFKFDCSHPIESSLPNLHTLHGITPKLFKADCLDKLSNLRTLVVARSNEYIIRVLSDATPISHSLEKLGFTPYQISDLILTDERMPNKFRTMNLSQYENLRKLSVKDRMDRFPQLDKLPPNLTKLTLKYTHLENDPIETLKQLPQLKILKLGKDSYEGEEMVCTGEHGNFLQLEVLRIEDMRNLEQLIVEEGGMPKLKKFTIVDCNPTTRIPDRIKSIMKDT